MYSIYKNGVELCKADSFHDGMEFLSLKAKIPGGVWEHKNNAIRVKLETGTIFELAKDNESIFN